MAYILAPMLKAAAPVVWFVNLFVQGLLKLLRIKRTSESGSTLTQEELRSAFADGWRVRSIRESRYESLAHEGGAQAWLMRAVRTP